MFDVEIKRFMDGPSIKNKMAFEKLFSEAARGDTTASSGTDQVSIFVIKKAIENIMDKNKNVESILKNPQGFFEDSTTKNIPSSIIELAKQLDKGNLAKDGGKYIKDVEKLSKLAVNTSKKYSKKMKNDNNIINTVNTAIYFAYFESLGILSEACVDIAKGKSKSTDDYINSNNQYLAFFKNVEILVKETDITKIQVQLIKEDFNMMKKEISLMDSISMYLDGDDMFFSEASLPVARILKLGLMKSFYVIMGPVRYLIYLMFYTKYNIDQRIEQIKNTVDAFKTSELIPKDDKLNALEKRSREIKVDRIRNQSKVDEKIENDKKSTTDDFNGSVEF